LSSPRSKPPFSSSASVVLTTPLEVVLVNEKGDFSIFSWRGFGERFRVQEKRPGGSDFSGLPACHSIDISLAKTTAHTGRYACDGTEW